MKISAGFIPSVWKPIAVGIALAVLTACGGGSSSGSGTGSFSLSITDAAVDSALAVVVEFTGVEIQPEFGERITITYAEPKQIDLLALTGGESQLLLDGQSLPSGSYSWIRLMVDEAASYIDVGTGQQALRIPSGAQSGLKLNRGFSVAEDGSSAFTIDFDLRKSVTLANGAYKLRPTLRMVENTAVGTLAGIVANALVVANCSNATTSAGAVYLFEDENGVADDVDGDAGDPHASALVKLDANVEYAYRVAFLEAGEYLAAYTCDASSDEAYDPEDDDLEDDVLVFHGQTRVTIVAGETATLNFE